MPTPLHPPPLPSLPVTTSSPLDKQLQGACPVARQAVREGETQVVIVQWRADWDWEPGTADAPLTRLQHGDRQVAPPWERNGNIW